MSPKAAGFRVTAGDSNALDRHSCAPVARVASLDPARLWVSCHSQEERSDKLACCPPLEFHVKGLGVLASSHRCIGLSEGGHHPKRPAEHPDGQLSLLTFESAN